ncbi:MAG: hypothetical protein PHV53_11120 [Fermentimonas sp.]|nr:hypothetical protein [Fermentimonas sp.]
MRHDILHITLCIIILGVGFSGCRASKTIQRDQTIQTNTEKFESINESVNSEAVTAESSDRSGSEVNQSYTRITEFDSAGTVRRVQETWRDRQRIDLVTEERTVRTVSVAEKNQQITIRDTTSTVTNEVVEVKTDSRPIQGFEWFWTVLSGVLILAVIIYIIYNRRK